MAQTSAVEFRLNLALIAAVVLGLILVPLLTDSGSSARFGLLLALVVVGGMSVMGLLVGVLSRRRRPRH